MLSSEIQKSMDLQTSCPHHVKNISLEVRQSKSDVLIPFLMSNCPYLQALARASRRKCASLCHIDVPSALDAQSEHRIHSDAC